MNEIKVTFNDNSTETFSSNVSLLEISKSYQTKMSNLIVGAKINNIIVPLMTRLTNDTKVNFIDFNDLVGYKMYQSGLKYVMIVAVKELLGSDSEVLFLNSIGQGMLTRIITNQKVDENIVLALKNKMLELIKNDYQFEKVNVHKKEAFNYYKSNREVEKALNIQFIPNSFITMYRLKNHYNYFYTDMPYSTGCLTKFELTYYKENNIILRYPTPYSKGVIPALLNVDKTFGVFEKQREWLEKVKVPYACQMNEVVADSQIKSFSLASNLIISENFTQLTKNILNNEKIKVVLVAGPSGSGKTTTSHRLAMAFRTFGRESVVISVDNFFKERSETSKDSNGEYEFDIFETIDLELFERDLIKLINKQEIDMPSFNFYTGKKEYTGKKLKLNKNEIIIIEGLHCLNDKLTNNIPAELKYKIYICPFNGLTIDRHNHISTIDMRLLRRIVRDNIYRGYSVEQTLKNWNNVRKAESEVIFGYEQQADVLISTAVTYEIGILKVFAEPLLYSIPVTSEYYEEARRLLGFLRVFFPISSEYVYSDSVLREFIGGSIYKE